MPLFRTALAVALLLVASGCFFFGGSNIKVAPLPEIKSTSTAKIVWQASVPASRQFVMFPAVAAGGVFAAAQNGVVARFDAKTGREIWRVNVGQRLSAGVGASAELVVVGTLEGEVIALTGEGKPAWRSRVSSEVQGPPVVTEDIVVVRSADTRIFAFEARDGKRRWLYQRAAPALTVRTDAGAVAARGQVFAGFAGGKMISIASNNGGLRWESTVSLPKGTTELERVSDVVGAPWLAEREVCGVSFQGRAACFDSNTGNTLWTKDVSSTAGLSGDNRYVFISEERGGVTTLDRSTGNSMWRQDKLGGRTLSVPVAVGREVVAGDMQGYLHIMARDTGSFTGRLRTDSSGIFAPPVRIEDGVVVQTRAGNLYAIALE